MLCEKLLNNCISVSCDNPVFAGMENTGYLFNKSEIASLTYDQTNPNIVTDINMKEISTGVNAVGYEVLQLGTQAFNGTKTSLEVGTNGNKFAETVQFIVPDNSPSAAMILDNLANGSFMFVGENEYAGSDNKGALQIYGAKKKLTCSAMERTAYEGDADGGWVVTLSNTGSPNSAIFLYKTDAETTKSYIESLVDCGE